MTRTTTPETVDELVRPRLDHRVAMRLAATEYDRMADVLAALSAEEWALPTECPAWDVRALGCHMVGMAAMAASPLESRRQQKKAAADAAGAGTDHLTALTALQVSERSGWAPADVVAGARRVGPRAARGRRWAPSFVRGRAMPQPQDVGGRLERWSLGYLVDTILTRDPWMHRMDIARATGREPVLTPDHDGVIVADGVTEWAARHDAPYELELTGPAGGTWRRGQGGEHIEMDAIDFCRVLSGRGQAQGLLAVAVPF
jgi:uncharacterized protein (TIGR03083 family)